MSPSAIVPVRDRPRPQSLAMIPAAISFDLKYIKTYFILMYPKFSNEYLIRVIYLLPLSLSLFSSRAIKIRQNWETEFFLNTQTSFNSTLLRRGYSYMRSRSSSNFWSIPPRCYRIMTCLELLKWYAKFLMKTMNSIRFFCTSYAYGNTY